MTDQTESTEIEASADLAGQNERVVRRCNVWEMKEGEHCRLNDRLYVRCPNIRKRIPTLGVVDNAVLRAVDDMTHRQLFLRGVDVDVVDA